MINNTLKFCVAYLILITWNKAGHAEGYGTLALGIIGGIIVLNQILEKQFWNKKSLLLYLPIVGILMLSVIAWYNPQYRSIIIEDINDLNFEKALTNSQSAEKVEMITNGIKLVMDQSKKDPSTSLAIFYHFKNSYIDKFIPDKKDSIHDFLINLENKIKIKNYNFIPSCTVRDPNYFTEIYFIFLSLFIGVTLYKKLENKSQIHFMIWIFLLNCLALTIVGYYQRLTHEWTDNYIEILGIWNAPEPRYYFSTFTYKNHWSAYVILMFFCNIFLLNKEFNNSNLKGYNLMNNKVFLILLIFSLIISSSILFSGSRSGLILLIISMIICCYKFSNSFSYKKLFILKSASRFILIICPLLFFIFYTFGKDPKHKEMLTNSISQWQNFLDGKPPLRFLLWKDTVEMIKHKPLWGCGYESFSSIYPKYQSSQVRAERAIGLENAHNPYVPLVAHAHSDILEYIAEWGLIGTFLVFFPFLFVLGNFLLTKSNSPSSILSYGCFVFLLYCFIDFPTRTPACLATFCAIFALSLKYNDYANKGRTRF